MIKFYKWNGSEIRKVARVDECGNKKVVAVIGKVSDLLEQQIIFRDNTHGNLDKWLLIDADNPESIKEFESLQEAKAASPRCYER